MPLMVAHASSSAQSGCIHPAGLLRCLTEGVVFMVNAMTHITSKMPGALSAETTPALHLT
jgi:hypothetical protein